MTYEVGNQAYNNLKEGVLKGEFHFENDTIVAALCADPGASNTLPFDATDALTSALSINTNGTGNLLSKSVSTTGVFTAADISISVNASTTRSIVLYEDDTTDQPLCWFDTGQGLESTGGTTTSGNAVQITWNGSGIFSIG